MADSPSTKQWKLDSFTIPFILTSIALGFILFSKNLMAWLSIGENYPAAWQEPVDWLRNELTQALGGTATIFWLGWLTTTWLVLRSTKSQVIAIHVIGWLLITLSSAMLATEYPLNLPQIGTVAGGSLGRFFNSVLKNYFEPVGMTMIAAGGLALGVVLALDVLVWKCYCFLLGLTKKIIKGIWRILHGSAQVLKWLIRGLTRIRIPRRSKSPIKKPIPVSPLSPPVVVDLPRIEEPKMVPIEEPKPPTENQAVSKDIPTTIPPELPSIELLDEIPKLVVENHDEKLRGVAVLLEQTFKDFGLNVRVVGIHPGPVVTQYEIALETGLRLTKVTALADDVALNLRVPSVRIVAPIPGKNTVGIEVPNANRVIVRLRELVQQSSEKMRKSKLPLFLGKDSEGNPLVYDLAEMPHLLIAGRTGTGKSVCLNSIIVSILISKKPDECKLLMIDPKQVELAEYGKLPHLMHPVVTENSKAEAILAWAVEKMEERYEILRRTRVRNIASYNDLEHTEILRRVKPVPAEADKVPARMPYIVIVIDEVGDLMMAMKKEVEGHIIRLAQKSRAAGIHLILTTQRPTVDVITGLIKSNLPARICFQVADRSNSRVVLDEMGAEKLLGKGDMLFLQPNTSTIVRAQGTYASDDEITRIVGFLEVENPDYDQELMNLEEKETVGAGGIESIRKRDELYEQAIEIVIREGRGSVSLLQRALGIGYGRAARLVDFMAEDGIVGTYNGAHAREVLYTLEQWQNLKQEDSQSVEAFMEDPS